MAFVLVVWALLEVLVCSGGNKMFLLIQILTVTFLLLRRMRNLIHYGVLMEFTTGRRKLTSIKHGS